jgi:hypothetical protein
MPSPPPVEPIRFSPGASAIGDIRNPEETLGDKKERPMSEMGRVSRAPSEYDGAELYER